jgi:hypothetical protein
MRTEAKNHLREIIAEKNKITVHNRSTATFRNMFDTVHGSYIVLI